MATQSKSLLFPFIIIAVLIFAVALAWKFMKPEATPSAENTVAEEPVVNTKPKTKPVIEVVSYDDKKPAVDEPMPILGEERIKAREKGADFMMFSMQLDSPEAALDTLKQYVDLGDTKKAENLIEYIYKAYPDTVIPSELLDF